MFLSHKLLRKITYSLNSALFINFDIMKIEILHIHPFITSLGLFFFFWIVGLDCVRVGAE